LVCHIKERTQTEKMTVFWDAPTCSKLRAFKNSVLRRIFEETDGCGGLIILYNEEMHNFYSSSDRIKMINQAVLDGRNV
jgi:hypothetical protein